MKQVAIKSGKSGMFVRFAPTRVIRTSDCNNTNLLNILDCIKQGAIFHKQALSIVYEQTKSNGVRFRQSRVLQAVMVSQELWDELLTDTPELVPFLRTFTVTDNFLLPDDRFSRSLNRLALEQNLRSQTFTVDEDGLVNVGVPFEEATLLIDPGTLIPTEVDGDSGVIEFPLGDAGEVGKFTFVTQGIYPVMKIQRTVEQPAGSDTGPIANATFAYVMSPSLATALNVSLP